MDGLLANIRFSARMMQKSPGFTAIVLLSLSLGVAATTTIFTVIYEVLLAPPLYEDTQHLVVLWESNSLKGSPRTPVAPATFHDWLQGAHSFEDLELVAPGSPVTVIGSGLPERANIQYATPGLFPLLGLQPALGRFFVADEIKSVNPVLLSYGFWNRHFSKDSNIIGKKVTVNGTADTIVGVLPEDFHLFDQDTDLWMPIERPGAEAQDRAFRSWLIAVGKLRPDATLHSAQAEMNFLAERIAEAHPETNKDWGVKVEPIQEAQFGYWKSILYLLFGIVVFVLLISCANVANLLLGRLSTRGRELCVRASLGASRRRIVGQLITEGLFLGMIGSLLGWLLAYAGIDLFRAVAPASFPLLGSIHIKTPAFLFCLGVSLVSGAAVSITPAFFASRLDLIGVLKSTAQTAIGSAYRRYRNALVTAEITLSLVLLSGAGLMMNSMWRLLRIDPGFHSEGVVTMQMFLSGPKYFEFGPNGVRIQEKVGSFYQRLLERASAIPGVQAAGMVSWLPEMGYNTGRRERNFRIVGQNESGGSFETAAFNAVSAGYFKTLQIPLLSGRYFDAHDIKSGFWVAIVNEAFAQRYFHNESPIGKQLLTDDDLAEQPRVIVGVAGNTRQNALDEVAAPEIFVPYLQQPDISSGHGYQNRVHMVVVVRTPLEAAAIVRDVRNIAADMDADQPVYGIRTMSEVVSESTFLRRLYARLLELCAGIALFLSVIGIYGIMSHSVTQRTNEIGLRIAIGANLADILRMVFFQGSQLVLTGLGIGLVFALLSDRLLNSYLFGIGPGDPLTMTACCLLLSAIAAGAIWVPARRASRVDPNVALRYE